MFHANNKSLNELESIYRNDSERNSLMHFEVEELIKNYHERTGRWIDGRSSSKMASAPSFPSSDAFAKGVLVVWFGAMIVFNEMMNHNFLTPAYAELAVAGRMVAGHIAEYALKASEMIPEAIGSVSLGAVLARTYSSKRKASKQNKIVKDAKQ